MDKLKLRFVYTKFLHVIHFCGMRNPRFALNSKNCLLDVKLFSVTRYELFMNVFHGRDHDRAMHPKCKLDRKWTWAGNQANKRRVFDVNGIE